MTVCERIDELLKEKGMSRRQLAIKAGIAPSSLQSALQRNKGLSLDMLFPISDVLKVDIEYLYEGEPSWLRDAVWDTMSQAASTRKDSIERFIHNELGLMMIDFFEELNHEGRIKSVDYMHDLVRSSHYQRTEHRPKDEQGKPSTTQEKPTEGQITPADGK